MNYLRSAIEKMTTFVAFNIIYLLVQSILSLILAYELERRDEIMVRGEIEQIDPASNLPYLLMFIYIFMPIFGLLFWYIIKYFRKRGLLMFLFSEFAALLLTWWVLGIVFEFVRFYFRLHI